MTMQCAACTRPVTPATSEPFRFGPAAGAICKGCSEGAVHLLARWMRTRAAVVEAELAEQAKLERQQQEADAAAMLAKEQTHHQLAQLSLEGFPIATRSEVARARRRSAA